MAAEALRESQEIVADEESREFMRRHTEYLRADANLDALTSVLAFNELRWSEAEIETRDIAEAREALIEMGSWTAQNLELAWSALKAHGHATLRPGLERKLSDAEQLEVVRLGQQGMNLNDANLVVRAVLTYCEYALGVEAAEVADDFGNPTFRPVIDRAAMFVFENCCPSYSPSRERRAALKSYIAGRAITMPLLFEAWRQVQQDEQRGFSRELLRNDEPAQENLDDLNDDEVQAPYKRTRSYIAKTYPGPGILN